MRLSETQTEEIILKLLKKQCGYYVPKNQELLATGILGSFQLFELVCDLEEAFDIRFSQDDLKKLNHFSSVDAISKILKEYIEG